MIFVVRRCMTALAVRQILMAELGVPVSSAVTLGALAGEVTSRRLVAALAIGKAFVAEGGAAPARGVVTL